MMMNNDHTSPPPETSESAVAVAVCESASESAAREEDKQDNTTRVVNTVMDLIKHFLNLKAALKCPICLDTMEDPVCLAQCMHAFCRTCIKNSFLKTGKNECPTCKTKATRRSLLYCTELKKIAAHYKQVQSFFGFLSAEYSADKRMPQIGTDLEGSRQLLQVSLTMRHALNNNSKSNNNEQKGVLSDMGLVIVANRLDFERHQKLQQKKEQQLVLSQIQEDEQERLFDEAAEHPGVQECGPTASANDARVVTDNDDDDDDNNNEDAPKDMNNDDANAPTDMDIEENTGSSPESVARSDGAVEAASSIPSHATNSGLTIEIAQGEGVILATLHVQEGQKNVVLRVGNDPSFELSRRNHSDDGDGDENHVPTENSGLAIKIANGEGVILATLHVKEGQKDVVLRVGNDPSDVATPRSTRVATLAPSPEDAMTNTSSSKDENIPGGSTFEAIVIDDSDDVDAGDEDLNVKQHAKVGHAPTRSSSSSRDDNANDDVALVADIQDTEAALEAPSGVPTEADLRANANRKEKNKSKQRAKTFPEELMQGMVDQAGNDDDAVAWSPDGKSFVIVSPADLLCSRIFANVLKECKYESFVRKLRKWGFMRLGPRTGIDCFWHPVSLRVYSLSHEYISRMWADCSAFCHNVGCLTPVSSLAPSRLALSTEPERCVYQDCVRGLLGQQG
jgi:hypothetical protein